jgi:hypothetical protein
MILTRTRPQRPHQYRDSSTLERKGIVVDIFETGSRTLGNFIAADFDAPQAPVPDADYPLCESKSAATQIRNSS